MEGRKGPFRVFRFNIYSTAKIDPKTNLMMTRTSTIGDFVLIACKELRMGRGSQINAYSALLGRGTITLGRDVVIGYRCTLMTSVDSARALKMNDASPEENREIRTAPITIKEDAFIGSHCIIMPGVTIGKRSVIGAGCYIDKDVENGKVVLPKQELRDIPRTAYL